MKEKVKNLLENRKIQYGILAFLFLFYLLTRLFRLGHIPKGISLDELGAAFDAQGIAHYGVDRWLVHMPPFFRNYDSGQNALYIYSAAVLFRIMKFTLARFRLVAVAYGAAAFFSLFLLAKNVFQNIRTALFGCFLYTVMPVFLMSQRWGLESYLFLSMTFLSVCSFHFAFQKKGIGWYALSGLLWGITLYTYGIAYVHVPLFLILMFLYMLYLKQISVRQTVCFTIPLMILALPLILQQLVIKGILPPMRILFSDIVPTEWSRANEVSFRYFFRNISRLWILFSRDNNAHNASAVYGTLYYISVPLFLIGLMICIIKTWRYISEKEYDFSVVLCAFFLCGLITTLLLKEININRANQMYFSFLFLILYAVDMIGKRSRKAEAGLLLVYMSFFLLFSNYYYRGGNDRDIENSEGSFLFQRNELGMAVSRMEDLYGEDHEIVIMADAASGWHFQIATYAGTSPYEYDMNNDGPIIREKNYVIGVPEELDLSGKTVYIIGNELHHVTDYLISCGFQSVNSVEGNYAMLSLE